MLGGRRHQYERCALCEDADTLPEEEQPRIDFPDFLPICLTKAWWGIPQEVKDVMLSKQASPDAKLGEFGSYLTMFDISGPVVHLLWIAALLLWPFLICLPVVAFTVTECNGLGMPRYKLWVWLCACPFLLSILIIELRAFTYTVIPVTQWVKPFKVMGIPVGPSWSFVWFAWNFFLTLAAKTDLVTQCLLLASTWRWFSCAGWKTIARAWEEIWAHSFLCHLSSGSDLKHILVLTWIAMLVQLPIFVCSALPVKCFGRDCVDCECQGEKQGYEVCWPDVQPEKNFKLSFSRVWHADALKTLASLNRMAMLTEGQFQLQLERAHCEFNKKEMQRGFQILKMELQHMIPRIMLVNFLQNCIKLEVQTTIFCLGRMVMPERMNWQCLFCLVLSQLTSWNELSQIAQRALRVWNAVASFQSKDGATEPELHPEAPYRTAIWWQLGIVGLIVLFCALVQLHSFGKLVGAFYCEDSVWNFPDKCVDVHGF